VPGGIGFSGGSTSILGAMRILTITLALLISALSALAADVAGAWTLTIDSPQGPVEVTLTLKQDGDKVTGTLGTPRGSTDVTGTVKDKDLALNTEVQGQTATITAKVDDAGKLTGNMSVAGFDIPVTGTKAAAKP
jgi:hypothetical protein